jgi:predicted type IV restriction endonuclease
MMMILMREKEMNQLPAEWKAIAMCESSMNPQAVSPSGKYMGLFQFSQESWQFVGMPGTPLQATVNEQFAAARVLKSIQGWKAWPVCSKKVGLR